MAIGADAVDRWLPQTQCRRCGYCDCRSYAEAVADGSADIDRCPPGGMVTARALAHLLDRPPRAPDPALGDVGPRRVAHIVEARCIGCRLCLEACPVDAIVGAPGRLHTVIERDCTGCALCLEPCPMDCIDMGLPPPAAACASGPWPDYPAALVERSRERAARRRRRLEHEERPRPRSRARAAQKSRRRREVLAAVQRTNQRRRTAAAAAGTDRQR